MWRFSSSFASSDQLADLALDNARAARPTRKARAASKAAARREQARQALVHPPSHLTGTDTPPTACGVAADGEPRGVERRVIKGLYKELLAGGELCRGDKVDGLARA